MSLSIIHLDSLTISGSQSKLSDPVSNELSIISAEKSRAFANFKQPAGGQQLFAVNHNDAGDSLYILGTATSTSNIRFELPEGDYVEFDLNISNREDADQQIGAMYGEVGMSKEYAIGDSFSLEQLGADGTVQKLFVPVIKAKRMKTHL